MEAIRFPVWVTEYHSTPPIAIVDDCTVPLLAEFQDLALPPGAEVIVYVKAGTAVRSAKCTVDGNTAYFTPAADFFQIGQNLIQFEVNETYITFPQRVSCGRRISKGV